MSIVANEKGLVENRILDSANNYNEQTLRQVSNYLNSKFSGKTIEEIKKGINDEIKSSKLELNIISKKLVQKIKLCLFIMINFLFLL